MLAAFVAGAVLGIVANSVPTAAPKSVTVLLIRRCPQQRDCLREKVLRGMKDETSKIWSYFDVRIDSIDPGDAPTSAVDVTVLLEESAGPAPHAFSKSGVVLAELQLPDTPCGTGVARVWVTQARRYAAEIPDVHFPGLPHILSDLFLHVRSGAPWLTRLAITCSGRLGTRRAVSCVRTSCRWSSPNPQHGSATAWIRSTVTLCVCVDLSRHLRKDCDL